MMYEYPQGVPQIMSIVRLDQSAAAKYHTTAL